MAGLPDKTGIVAIDELIDSYAAGLSSNSTEAAETFTKFIQDFKTKIDQSPLITSVVDDLQNYSRGRGALTQIANEFPEFMKKDQSAQWSLGKYIGTEKTRLNLAKRIAGSTNEANIPEFFNQKNLGITSSANKYRDKRGPVRWLGKKTEGSLGKVLTEGGRNRLHNWLFDRTTHQPKNMFNQFHYLLSKKRQAKVYNGYLQGMNTEMQSSIMGYLSNNSTLTKSANLRRAMWMDGLDLKLYRDMRSITGEYLTTAPSKDLLNILKGKAGGFRQQFESLTAGVFKYDDMLNRMSGLYAGTEQYEEMIRILGGTKTNLASLVNLQGGSKITEATGLEQKLLHQLELATPEQIPRVKAAIQEAIKAKAYNPGNDVALQKLAASTLDDLQKLPDKMAALMKTDMPGFAEYNTLKYNTQVAGKFAAKSGIILMAGSFALDAVDWGVKKLWKVANSASKWVDGLKSTEFGNGRALTTQKASTERQKSLSIIRNNRYGARRNLGFESQLINQ